MYHIFIPLASIWTVKHNCSLNSLKWIPTSKRTPTNAEWSSDAAAACAGRSAPPTYIFGEIPYYYALFPWKQTLKLTTTEAELRTRHHWSTRLCCYCCGVEGNGAMTESIIRSSDGTEGKPYVSLVSTHNFITVTSVCVEKYCLSCNTRGF